MSTPSDIQRDITRGLAWVGMSAALVAVLDVGALFLIVKFWITRDEFGVATVVMTSFGALELVAEMGFSAAIIQKDNHSDDTLSTIFWLNLLAGAFFCGLVFVMGPLLASLHHQPVMAPMFRVFGLNLIIRSGGSLHYALLRKALRFRELSLLRSLANLVDFAVKIGTALAGYGLWCFLFGALARSAVNTIGMPFLQKFTPRAVFRPRQALPYARFGLKASASEILFQLYSNLDYQVVSLFFGVGAVGLYRAGYELVLEPVRFVSGVVVGVAFPAFSRLKDNTRAIMDQFLAFVRQNFIVVLPLVAIIWLVPRELLVLLTKPEYAEAATTARVLAAVGILRALSQLGPPLLDGLGRPDLTLRYQLTATVVLALLYVVCAQYLGPRLGVLSIAIAWAVGYPIAFAVLATAVGTLIGLDARTFLRHVRGTLACVLGAAAVGALVKWLTLAQAQGVRLAVVATATLLALGFFLAYFQKISPRSVWLQIRGRKRA